jgi:hypothetical protein
MNKDNFIKQETFKLFSELPIGARFLYCGAIWFKKSSRTAWLMIDGTQHWFHFGQKDFVSVI